MQPRRGLDNMTDLTRLQVESSIFKLLLHIALAEVAQISHLACTAAIRLTHSKISQGGLSAADSLLVGQNDGHSLILCTSYVGLQITMLASAKGPP